jgi:hypothetical protein
MPRRSTSSRDHLPGPSQSKTSMATNNAGAAQLLAVSRMIATSLALLARERRIPDGYTEEGRCALINYVRRRSLVGDRDLVQLGRDTRTFGERALSFLEDGLGSYAPRRQTLE